MLTYGIPPEFCGGVHLVIYLYYSDHDYLVKPRQGVLVATTFTQGGARGAAASGGCDNRWARRKSRHREDLQLLAPFAPGSNGGASRRCCARVPATRPMGNRVRSKPTSKEEDGRVNRSGQSNQNALQWRCNTGRSTNHPDQLTQPTFFQAKCRFGQSSR